MDRDGFEAKVIALSHEGKRLTVANVTALTGIAPRKAEAWLDAMVVAGRLDSDIDEKDAVVVYRVRGLDALPQKVIADREAKKKLSLLEQMESDARGAVVAQAKTRAKEALLVTKPGERSVALGGLLGLIFGPLGLLYSAPLLVVLVSVLGYAILGAIPIIRTLFAFIIVPVHLAFGVAGALYTLRFNQKGERTPLLPPEEDPKRLGR